MNATDRILVLIGQIGAGKSEISRHLVSITGACHLTIENLRYRGGSPTGSLSVVDDVVSRARTTPTILECSGASRDFEEIVEGIRLRGISCLVVLLECSTDIAMHRVLERDPLSRPRSGRSWASELRWTKSRLRFVPADYSVSTEEEGAEAIASRIHRMWARAPKGKEGQCPPTIPMDVSFSKLATYQVCPLSYELKYGQDVPVEVESKQMFLGRILHETLAGMYGAASHTLSRNEVMGWFKRRVTESVPPNFDPAILQAIVEAGEHALAFHYDVVFQREKRRTIAVEKVVRMTLGAGVNFVGRVDRIAVDETGVVEVIDYKTSSRTPASRPRIPDRLQIAGYSAAILREFDLTTVIAREISLQTGIDERFPVAMEDARQVNLALVRWSRRLCKRGTLVANVGPHCASCQFNPVCPEDAKAPISADMIV